MIYIHIEQINYLNVFIFLSHKYILISYKQLEMNKYSKLKKKDIYLSLLTKDYQKNL